MPTAGERAAFEAGVKFGSLYHQFAGTPVSPDSAPSLARAMEAAIENQPHCERVSVEVREDRLASAIDEAAADYVELTGRFLDVEVDVDREGTRAEAHMAMTEGYPLMELDRVE